MNVLRIRTCLIVLGVALVFNVAAAFDPQLSPAEVQRAVQAGAQMATPASGYKLQAWVLFEVKDPFIIHPQQGLVEAVITGTPFERLRYASYLAAFQGQTLKPAAAQKLAAQLDNTVTFIVFAHAPGGGDQYRDFLKGFRAASLSVNGSGETLKPVHTEIVGPAQDFYNVPGKAAEFRWLGNVAFRFDLKPLTSKNIALSKLGATFSFTDSAGQHYHFPVKLGNYH